MANANRKKRSILNIFRGPTRSRKRNFESCGKMPEPNTPSLTLFTVFLCLCFFVCFSDGQFGSGVEAPDSYSEDGGGKSEREFRLP